MKIRGFTRSAGKYWFLFVFIAIYCVASVAGQQNRMTMVSVTRNTLAPELYSEQINLQVLLVNSPGAKEKGTTFAGAYTMYFIPEGEIENLTRSRGGRIEKLLENDISNKTLLGSGEFKLNSPGPSRVYEKTGISFKSKVAEDSRKMLGKITIFYTVKIYDAKLAKTIYDDKAFIYSVFDGNEKKVARKILNVNFFVTENGEIFSSSWPKDKTDTTW